MEICTFKRDTTRSLRIVSSSDCFHSISSLLLHLYPTSMRGRYGTIVASMQLDRTPPLLTVHSLSDRLSHSPPTSSSVFLSFCFLALLYPPPSFRILHTHESLLITCPYHCILRSWTFFEISRTTFVFPLISSPISEISRCVNKLQKQASKFVKIHASKLLLLSL